MSENTKKSESSVSTETPDSSTSVPSVPEVADVINALVSGVSRPESGFDRLDRKGRGLARKAISARFDRLMREGRFDTAKSVWDVLGTLSGTSGMSGKSEIDVKSETARTVRMLRFAADALMAGNVGLDGFDPVEVSETDIDDLPDMTDEEVATATKYANRKIARKSPENDIAAAIIGAFESVSSGTYMKVSDIRKAIPSADSSWDGRISARLFPASGVCTVSGIVPVPVGPDGKKGAKKA